jgi:RNA polymerase sigma-70 factor (ECF subfamily)
MEAWANDPSATAPSPLERLTHLVAQMRRGDERALEELYDTTVGKMFALAKAILRHEKDAEEVVCATYAFAWANAGRYDPERANVLGWLTMLCRSRALDVLRRRRADAATAGLVDAGQLQDEGHGPDDLLSLIQQQSLVHAALCALTAQRRRLVSMAFLQGLSHPQIARATGLPLGTVKSHIRRALNELRDRLKAV